MSDRARVVLPTCLGPPMKAARESNDSMTKSLKYLKSVTYIDRETSKLKGKFFHQLVIL
ncbi:MAG: hypothetical protein NT027_20405 [Proteobacteria bacterium]|nr:hypothetical protein [Pseudomonadota bacterium]